MKLRSTLSVLSLAVTSLLFSCNKEANVQSTKATPIGTTQSISNQAQFAGLTTFATFKAEIDAIGNRHNDCMVYIKDYIDDNHTADWSTFTNTEKYNIVEAQVVAYFATQSQDVSYLVGTTLYESTDITANIADIQEKVEKAGSSYLEGAITSSEFDDECDVLKEDAFALANDDESLASGIMVAVAQSSFKFWKVNLTSYCTDLNPTGTTASYLSTRQAEVGKADLKGAVRGAFSGAAGGLAGAIFGASFGAAIASFSEAVIG